MRSLQARLLFSSTIVLSLFLLISAVALDHFFRTQKVNDIVSRLNVFVQSIMAEIEIKDEDGLCKSLGFIGDAGFSAVDNPALFARVVSLKGKKETLLWASTSTTTDESLRVGTGALGKLIHKIVVSPGGRSFVSVSYKASLPVVTCENQNQFNRPGPRRPVSTESNPEPNPENRTSPDERPLHGNEKKHKHKHKQTNIKPFAPMQTFDTGESDAKPVTIVIRISEALDTPHELYEEDSHADNGAQGGSGGSEQSSARHTYYQIDADSFWAVLAIDLDPPYSYWEDIVDPGLLQSPANINIDDSDSYSAIVQRTYYDDVFQFRVTLAIGFFAVLSIYLTLFLVFLRLWGLLPMRKVSEELEMVKSGTAGKLTGIYPEEISGLTDSINRLIVSERAQQERYRNSLGDLAHSLKTPLSVLVAVADKQGLPNEFKQDMQDQVMRMRQIVDYQLKRAAAGRTTLAAPVPVGKSVQRLANTLLKAYADKKVRYSQEVASGVVFLGDEGDFLEVFGNLMENAFKWCHGEVRVTAAHLPQGDKFQLIIGIEDNGPGVPEDKIESVLNRGFRADEAVSGQGIGLSVVREILSAYKGKLEIGKSSLGGAVFRVML